MVSQNTPNFRTISFSQGAKFIELQNNKILKNPTSNCYLNQVNGYDVNGCHSGQAALRTAPSKIMAKNQTLIEGFGGGAGAISDSMHNTDTKPVTDVNAKEFRDVKKLTALYNKKLKAYQKAYTTYINNSGTFTKSMPGDKGVSKQYAGQNIVIVGPSGKSYTGYITKDGFYKYINTNTRAAALKLESDLADAQNDVTDAKNALAKITAKDTASSDNSIAENAAKLILKNATKKLEEAEQAIKDNDCPIDIAATINASANGPLWNAGTKINTTPPIYTSTPMTASYKCDTNDNDSSKNYDDNMVAAMSSDKQALDTAYSNLINTKQQIDAKIKALKSSNSSIVGALGDEISQLQTNISDYENITNDITTEEESSMDVKGMYEDSGLNAVSRNSQFLLWSILATGIVTIGIIKTNG